MCWLGDEVLHGATHDLTGNDIFCGASKVPMLQPATPLRWTTSCSFEHPKAVESNRANSGTILVQDSGLL